MNVKGSLLFLKTYAVTDLEKAFQVPPNFHPGLIDPFSFLICHGGSTKDQALTLKGHLTWLLEFD